MKLGEALTLRAKQAQKLNEDEVHYAKRPFGWMHPHTEEAIRE
jgi:hypothetical protein